MGAALRQWPPPPAPPYSRPGLARTSPEREEEKTARELARLKRAAWFRDWCTARNISVRVLAGILGVASSTARKKLIGELAVSMLDVEKFPDRHFNDLVLAFAASKRSSNHGA